MSVDSSNKEHGQDTSIPSLTVDDFESLATRVDQAIAEVRSMDTPERNKAMNLKSAIEEFHKVGLTEIVRTLKDDPRGKELLFQLVDVPAVYALFSMHGLVRADLRTKVSRVLEMVRPYMQSHGGDVRLVDIRDRTVLVQLDGNCNGCSMSSVTLRNTVEESLREHVPEIDGVEVVSQDVAPESSALLQLGSTDQGEHGWVEGPTVQQMEGKSLHEFQSGEDKILLISTKQGLRAYRNACAHQGLPLDGGIVDQENGTITCPWHGFQFDSESGECFSAPQCQLEPFPLRVRDGKIWVRPV